MKIKKNKWIRLIDHFREHVANDEMPGEIKFLTLNRIKELKEILVCSEEQGYSPAEIRSLILDPGVFFWASIEQNLLRKGKDD